jgi:hypothetical protein
MTELKTELTLEDATKVVDALGLEGTVWRKWQDRSDSERLAIGIVILQKSMKGKSMRTIEKEMGIPLATCQRYKERALSSIQLPTVEQARAEEIQRLDALMEAVWPAADRGDKEAIASYMKISERKAKMLGWDKPIEITQTVTEITAAERELQEMLAQAERDAKMAQDALVKDHVEA